MNKDNGLLIHLILLCWAVEIENCTELIISFDNCKVVIFHFYPPKEYLKITFYSLIFIVYFIASHIVYSPFVVGGQNKTQLKAMAVLLGF